jgi:hypothetical protein
MHHSDDCDRNCVPREPDCAEGYEHRWTRRGCGGSAANPGIWSLGGTAHRELVRCVLCGLRRSTTTWGWQRDPYQCDEVRYEDEIGHEVAAGSWAWRPSVGSEPEARAEAARQRRNERARARRRAKRTAIAMIGEVSR